ncbi:MAG: hypothetical protein ABIP94_19150 [Planctomycetota bacterium]
MALSQPLARPGVVAISSFVCFLALDGRAQGPGPVTVPGLPMRATPAMPARSLRTLLVEETASQQPGVPQEPAAAPKPPDPAAAAAAAAANARLQKWKQLTYDRRPSTILQAWAAPELKPYDPAEEKKSEDGKPTGSPAGAPTAKPSAPIEMGEGEIDPAEVLRFLDPRSAGQPGFVPPAASTPGQPGGPPMDPAAAAAASAAGKEQALAEKKLQRECEMLQRDVTLGRWHKVGEFLLTLPEKERKGAYEHFLKVLPNHPQTPQDQRTPPNLQEKNRFAFEDTFVLAALAPGGFDKKQIPQLAPFVQRAIEGGSVLEELVRLLEVEVKKPEAEQRIDRREAAILLATIGQELELGPFLPTASEAEAKNDREALNLLARHALAMFGKEQRNVYLQTAWQVTQAVLAKGEVTDEDKAQALRRAVELAPKVSADLGPAWLAESFTNRPERGMEIIATIGGQVAKGFQEKAQDANYRAKGLELQKTAVEALLKVAPELADQWKPTLGLLASGWIVEANWSYTNSQSDSFGPMMQRDEFGNMFWTNMRRGGGGQVIAVEPVDLLKAQPGPAWTKLLDLALEPHFLSVSAQLYLKVNEPEQAFPFIEQLADLNPRKAKDLANEFLRVWTRNNNPNSSRRTNSYMFMYGFEERASGIPLTRSKQERNLEDLGKWVERLRQLPIGGVDQKLLSEAFVMAHSTAEVYRLDTIEKVFGDVSDLDPVLLGELLSKMRTNLATVWRRPDVQEKAKTKRSQKETLLEVARGYETALKVAQRALEKRGAHWALLAVVASTLHDQNNFSRELARNSNFAEVRKGAFELFAQGAEHYVGTADGLRLDQETIGAFDTWFYAALGASDLGAIDEDTVVAKSQLPLIRDAIAQLPDGSRQRHQSMFANALFTRMSAVKPQIKYRYLESGFQIVGDNPQAVEAKKVWDYYQDLVHELRLVAVVDGSTSVGTKPFGVRIDIRHSPELERESGGFTKYAQNQNSMGFSYNYGRPLENYRDRFQEAATAALRENFEVLSVTFNSDAMTSKPTDEPGWRATPYAWMLLQARGPQIDRIPPVQIDFDFLDTSGYTVLPIGSAPVVIDASAKPEPRPFSNLQVTQILDERRASEGKVVLEIKAQAKGLVPEMETFLQLDTPGFVVHKRDDQGASVVRFAEEQDGIQSERVFLLSLEPAEKGSHPRSFVFGKPKLDGMTVIYQRYDDADLATVPAELALSGGYGRGNPTWAWVLLGVAFLAFGGWFFFVRPGRGAATTAGPLMHLPKNLTPFTVLGLLREVALRTKLDEDGKQQLQADIARIEACHFGRAEDPSLDLKAVAEAWLRRAG